MNWDEFQAAVEHYGSIEVPGAKWYSSPKTSFDEDAGEAFTQVYVSIYMPGRDGPHGSLRHEIVMPSTEKVGKELARSAVNALADWAVQMRNWGEICRYALAGGKHEGLQGDEPIPDHATDPPRVP